MFVTLIEITHLSILFSSIPAISSLPSPCRPLYFATIKVWPSAEVLPCEVCADLKRKDNLHIMAFYQSNSTLFGCCYVYNILVSFASSGHHNGK